MTEVLELSDNDFKVAIINMLQHAVINMLKPNENVASQQRIRKAQQRSRRYKELHEKFRAKNTINKIKNSMDELNSKIEGTEESMNLKRK